MSAKMIRLNNGSILFSILFFALVVMIVIKGSVPAATFENHPYNKTNNEINQSAIISPEVIHESQESSVPEAIELNISGEVLTCTNITNVEQVIDIRLINLDVKNKSIYLYPLNITIDLLPEQIKRIDLNIPYGTTYIKLVSSDGEEKKLKVPTCIGGSGSDGGRASYRQIETKPGKQEIPEYPTIVMPVIAILALLFIMKKRKI